MAKTLFSRIVLKIPVTRNQAFPKSLHNYYGHHSLMHFVKLIYHCFPKTEIAKIINYP